MDILNKVDLSWIPFFETNKEELDIIMSKIDYKNEIIYPIEKNIFKSLFYFPVTSTKLVFLGQDPYINYEIIDGKIIPQACGLSFSVPKSHKKVPPSLQNIYKEIKACYPEVTIPNHGSLIRWAKKENILLLNSALTVLEKKSNSHQSYWSNFTDKLIKYISDNNSKTIFLLMGNFAISKSKLINTEKHKIFTTVHPSPLSAFSGFFGCQIFKKINDYLIDNGEEPIIWLR